MISDLTAIMPKSVPAIMYFKFLRIMIFVRVNDGTQMTQMPSATQIFADFFLEFYRILVIPTKGRTEILFPKSYFEKL